MTTIYVLVPRGTVVFKAYTRENTARVHARTMTGVEAVAVELRDMLATEVHDDVGEYDEDDPTPVLDFKDPKKP